MLYLRERHVYTGGDAGLREDLMISIVENKNHLLISTLAEEVQNLHAQLHPELFKPFNAAAFEEALEKYLADPACFVYVAKQEEMPIGYILCFIKEIKENAFHYDLRTLYIDQISVLKAYQKSGAGHLLMEQAEKLANEKSIRRIELDHWSMNTVAAVFFRKKGYQLCKERLFKLL
jgi:ribosomal protein S18 acetylase RimI-like enzyme